MRRAPRTTRHTKDQESPVLGLGRLPREYIYCDAERQLLTVRRRVSYVIDGLGVTSGPRTRQTTGRLPQGYPGVPRRRRGHRHDRDAVPGLALYLFAHVLSQKR